MSGLARLWRTKGTPGALDVAGLMRVLLSVLLSVPRLLLVLVVRVYQLVVSPLLGPTCRYYPSCSAYCVQALTRHGVLWGTWLTVRRLLRCHPWTSGGVDDVPEQGWRAARGRRTGPSNAQGPTDGTRTVAGGTQPDRISRRDSPVPPAAAMADEAPPPGCEAPRSARVGQPRGRHSHHRSCGAEHPAPVN